MLSTNEATLKTQAPLPVARHLATMRAAQLSVLRDEVLQAPVLTNLDALLSYLRMEDGHSSHERLRIIFLDTQNRLIADEVFGHGSIDSAPVFPREIVRRALELGAGALILTHNHPSGDPRPSETDLETTRAIAAAATVFSIAVHDHLIVARSGWVSLRRHGWPA